MYAKVITQHGFFIVLGILMATLASTTGLRFLGFAWATLNALWMAERIYRLRSERKSMEDGRV